MLADLTMQLCSAAWQLPVIENLPVQRMDEFVALGRASVGKRLGARPSHDVMPARQLFVEILQTVRIDVRCAAHHARGERHARNARELQGAMFLDGKSFE